ncbi:MAG: hypothetical protein IJK04_12125 [Kiritimatiellae bacterium]|nr:hypothetical protein [Kiritimatiellia bacterium]
MNAAHPARRQSRRLRILAAAVAVAAGAAIPARADYQFIVSGYPAANESYQAASPSTSLETATRSGKSVSSALEARCRTWDESNATSLRSDKYEGAFVIIIR